MRTLATLLLLLAVGVAAVWIALLSTLFGFGLRCDDACDGDPTVWTRDVDAWQWTALGWGGVALLGVAAAAVVAVAIRPRTAPAAAVALVGACAAWAVFAADFFGSQQVWLVVAGAPLATLAASAVHPRRR